MKKKPPASRDPERGETVVGTTEGLIFSVTPQVSSRNLPAELRIGTCSVCERPIHGRPFVVDDLLLCFHCAADWDESDFHFWSRR